MSQAFHYFGDPIMEVATDTITIGVHGLVTEFPETASKYFRKCFKPLIVFLLA